MPVVDQDPYYDNALMCLEFCRFAYKMYAQTCTHPMDPFYEVCGEQLVSDARARMMGAIHEELGTDENEVKFDPIRYHMGIAPNPAMGTVYRAGTEGDPYVCFQPRPIDKMAAYVMGVDINGEATLYPDLGPSQRKKGVSRIAYFQGRTGMTKTWANSGWPSWFGAVVYNVENGELVVTFRGSRSGAGGRALSQALVYSMGSPDWVTDMQHLKGIKEPRFNDAYMVVGFWLAYLSCVESLEGAINGALNGAEIRRITFTGHSLGGALAQCAYLDMVGGTLMGKKQTVFKVKEMPKLEKQSSKYLALEEEDEPVSSKPKSKLVKQSSKYVALDEEDSFDSSPSKPQKLSLSQSIMGMGVELDEPPSPTAFQKKIAEVPIVCYAISAPPVLLANGRSVERVEAAIKERGRLDGARIFHVFCKGDAVHDHKNVGTSMAVVANSLIGGLTHPKTKTAHLGHHYPLKCKKGFPDAHEPSFVMEGILAAMGSVPKWFDPDGFWPLFDFDFSKVDVKVKPLWGGSEPTLDQFKCAISAACLVAPARELAEDWMGAKAKAWKKDYFRLNDVGGKKDLDAFDIFDEAFKYDHDRGNPFTEKEMATYCALMAPVFTAQLLELYEASAKKNATKACIWVMLQHLAVRQCFWFK